MLKRNERAAAVQAARRRLRLPAAATVQEIKEAYRSLAATSHPDLHSAEESGRWEAEFRDLNAAYELLMDYCSRYAFSFAESVVEQQCRRQDPAEYWKAQFFHDADL